MADNWDRPMAVVTGGSKADLKEARWAAAKAALKAELTGVNLAVTKDEQSAACSVVPTAELKALRKVDDWAVCWAACSVAARVGLKVARRADCSAGRKVLTTAEHWVATKAVQKGDRWVESSVALWDAMMAVL
jgi:hypothetical protein